jgi:hypothetical protein
MKWICTLLFLFPAVALAQRAEPAAHGDAGFEHFAALWEHNIFLRDRGHPAPAPSTTRPAASRTPEESLVLTGIVLEEDGFHAYVEDADSSKVLKLSEGDSIARGRIVDMDLNAVEYARGDQQTWIAVGSNFAGQATLLGAAPSTDDSSSSSSTQPTTLPFNPNDPNLTVEQQMKLRRRQELK